jgi:hypothetical protein
MLFGHSDWNDIGHEVWSLFGRRTGELWIGRSMIARKSTGKSLVPTPKAAPPNFIEELLQK